MVTTQNTKIIFRLFISTTKDNIDDDNIVPFLTIGNGDDVANVRLSELKEVLGKLFGARVQTQLPPARQLKALPGEMSAEPFLWLSPVYVAARNAAGIYIIIIQRAFGGGIPPRRDCSDLPYGGRQSVSYNILYCLLSSKFFVKNNEKIVDTRSFRW